MNGSREIEDLKEKYLTSCSLCPRNCRVDRNGGKLGRCHAPADILAARASLHMWEEPCISGSEGSGTVFFSGCSLGCVFCQNRDIALAGSGRQITLERLAGIFLELQSKGANNINLVTACHYVPHIVLALRMARQNGLKIPIVYNSSGYETVETLKMLDGLIDVYLPDFKYWEETSAARYSHAADYPEVARKALREMVRQVGMPCFDERGIIQKGVIVRHLLLPGHVKEAKAILSYLFETYGNDIYISIMSQYTPMSSMKDDPLLGRKVTGREYRRVLDYAVEIGIEQGFFQEGEVASESFIPAFDGEGIE